MSEAIEIRWCGVHDSIARGLTCERHDLWACLWYQQDGYSDLIPEPDDCGRFVDLLAFPKDKVIEERAWFGPLGIQYDEPDHVTRVHKRRYIGPFSEWEPIE